MAKLRNGKILSGLIGLAGLGLLVTSAIGSQETPSAPADSAKPASAGEPKNNVRPAMKWKRYDYTCEGGAKVAVYLRNNTAKIRTLDHIYMMRQTPSTGGERYSDGKILWWSRGDTGSLQEDTPDGNGKILVKGCVLDKPLNPDKP